MLRVLSDALSAADSRQLTLLALLDMSAAFDCVDHVLLYCNDCSGVSALLAASYNG